MTLMATVCGTCGADLTLVTETWDHDARVFVGSLDCRDCHASYVDQRRPHERRPTAGLQSAALGTPEPKKELIQMFKSEHIDAYFKDAKLRLVTEGEDSQKIAECRLVIEPFTYALAKELGADVAAHFFAKGGAMRGEIAKLELAAPEGEYQLKVQRHAETKRALGIRPVTVTAMRVERQDDEKAGKAWFRFTLTVSFGVYERTLRDFVVDWFGAPIVFTMQETQRALIPDEADAEATAH